jgi:NAD(P)-dependent dehydrogenase (short-subunit alcohol dehydrogenase family)
MAAERFSLAGKSSIVTGGAAGIGRACAETIASFGASVCIVDVDARAALRTARAIEQAGGRALVCGGDAREPGAAREAVDAAIARFGGIDILVNNVGGMFAASATRITPGGWGAVMRLNVETALNFAQAVAPAMLTRGGSIVNVASVAGLTASPGAAHYGAAKAAIISLTQTLSLEWAPRVRVNCVAPDFIRTQGTDGLMSAPDRRRMSKLIPLRRLGTPLDVANVVAFLASDMASFVTGQTIVIDGGALQRGRLDFMPSHRRSR